MNAKMQVVKLDVQGNKPMWAIKMPSGKYQGQYVADDGDTRFNVWARRKDAQAWLNKLIKDASDLMAGISKE